MVFDRELEKLKCVGVKKELIERLYNGDNIHEACAKIRINPAALTIARRNDVELELMIKDSRAYRADILVDSLMHLPEVYEDASMVSAVSRNIQWLAKTRYRELYGDKTDINHNVTVNIKDAMSEARKRLMHDVTPNILIDSESATDSVSVALVNDDDEIDPLS
jgi:hypothetical protein